MLEFIIVSVFLRQVILLFRCLDQAIIVSKEIGELSDIFLLAMKASNCYQQHGSPGSASLLLSKTADILQQSDPESSVKLLKEASNISAVCLENYFPNIT